MAAPSICQTSLGEVWLWGELTGKPVLLIVTGAFADPGTLDHAGASFPTVDVLRTHLPGNHCPRLAVVSVEAYAAALSEALAQIAPDVPLGIVGLSLGALVALGVRAPGLRHLLLVEPPLSTAETWHMAEAVQTESGSPEAALLWALFGIRDGEVAEPRDYTGLLKSLGVPTEVLVGDVPAEPRRPMARAPSFVGPAARALLEGHPLVVTTIAAGAGHNVPVHSPLLLYDALVRMVTGLMGAEAATGRPRGPE
jgi:hypothetical protein